MAAPQPPHLLHAVLHREVDLAALPNPVHLLRLHPAHVAAGHTVVRSDGGMHRARRGKRRRGGVAPPPARSPQPLPRRQPVKAAKPPHLLSGLVVPLWRVVWVAGGPHLGHRRSQDDQVGAARQPPSPRLRLQHIAQHHALAQLRLLLLPPAGAGVQAAGKLGEMAQGNCGAPGGACRRQHGSGRRPAAVHRGSGLPPSRPCAHRTRPLTSVNSGRSRSFCSTSRPADAGASEGEGIGCRRRRRCRQAGGPASGGAAKPTAVITARQPLDDAHGAASVPGSPCARLAHPSSRQRR